MVFDFSAFPVLETERLVLREWHPADASDIFVFRSDPIAQRYNSSPHRDVSDAQALINTLRTAYAAEEQIQWAITRRDNRPIGLFGFNSWQRFHRRAEIGYDLARPHWGQGIATEALTAILRFGFDHMHLHRIQAHTIATNEPSIRLLTRLGFHRDAVLREYSLEDDGHFHDSTIWSLLEGE
ncbi:GNAT family N-acetyltransferase [Nocardia sp. NPDC049526]|uniref:GNAT family N-acetyltransferase n=1 Tax=Nocardia sp. NPDC049526 TaxID=3364316 RepID=UPI0037BB5C57